MTNLTAQLTDVVNLDSVIKENSGNSNVVNLAKRLQIALLIAAATSVRASLPKRVRKSKVAEVDGLVPIEIAALSEPYCNQPYNKIRAIKLLRERKTAELAVKHPGVSHDELRQKLGDRYPGLKWAKDTVEAYMAKHGIGVQVNGDTVQPSGLTLNEQNTARNARDSAVDKVYNRCTHLRYEQASQLVNDYLNGLTTAQ